MKSNLTESDIEALQTRTERWPAGLQLDARSLVGRPDPHTFVTDFSGSHGYVLSDLRSAPQRVKSLALLGPMGLTPSTGKTVARIMVVQFFPLPWLQDWAAQWALGKDPGVLSEAEAWFRIIMTGVQPRVTLPVTFQPEEL